MPPFSFRTPGSRLGHQDSPFPTDRWTCPEGSRRGSFRQKLVIGRTAGFGWATQSPVSFRVRGSSRRTLWTMPHTVECGNHRITQLDARDGPAVVPHAAPKGIPFCQQEAQYQQFVWPFTRMGVRNLPNDAFRAPNSILPQTSVTVPCRRIRPLPTAGCRSLLPNGCRVNVGTSLQELPETPSVRDVWLGFGCFRQRQRQNPSRVAFVGRNGSPADLIRGGSMSWPSLARGADSSKNAALPSRWVLACDICLSAST